MTTVPEFYDALASGYDAMTDFEARFEKELTVMERIVKEYTIHSALDAGCGTGMHSLLLAKLGVAVTAIDNSKEMLRVAGEKARSLSLSLETIHSDFTDLAGLQGRSYDAVFCLGNTLAHVKSEEELICVLQNFKGLLNKGGVGIFQVVNFESILRANERIRNIKERNNVLYVRFYDFAEKKIAFNVLTIERTEKGFRHGLHTTELLPITSRQLFSAFSAGGWSECKLYGSLSLAPYDEVSSPDAVVVAKK